jgi:hypothetical protein
LHPLISASLEIKFSSQQVFMIFSDDKWRRIKTLAARLQAIKSMLEIFNEQIENQSFAHEFTAIKEQLEADFEQTLTLLLELIDEDDNT